MISLYKKQKRNYMNKERVQPDTLTSKHATFIVFINSLGDSN